MKFTEISKAEAEVHVFMVNIYEVICENENFERRVGVKDAWFAV